MRTWGKTRSAALIAIIPIAAALALSAPAHAADGPLGSVAGPGDPHLTYEGHWGHTRTEATTVNSGARLLFDFTGRTLHGLFDTSTITDPSQIYVSIDGGPQAEYTVGTDDIDFTPTVLSPGRHRAEIDVKDVDEYSNRWIPPLQSGVIFTGVRLSPGAHLVGQPRLGRLRMDFFGDSITEGVEALCESLSEDCADGTKDYAYLTGMAFHADVNQVGFGKQGLIEPGHGDVPPAAQSFGWNYAGSPAERHFHPDAVVINEGTNDYPYSAAQFRAAYLAYLKEIRAADPHAWIFTMRPFDGQFAADIAWAAGQMADPKIVYVDTSGWLSVADGDFNGLTHPDVKGHQIAAAHLIAFIEATTGWRAVTP